MAGRPPGAKNKRTMEVEIIASRFELNPFEVLMMMSAGDWKGLGYDEQKKVSYSAQGTPFEEDNIPISIRCMAAKEAAQYLYPKKKNIEVSMPTEEMLRRLEDEFKIAPVREVEEDQGEDSEE